MSQSLADKEEFIRKWMEVFPDATREEAMSFLPESLQELPPREDIPHQGPNMNWVDDGDYVDPLRAVERIKPDVSRNYENTTGPMIGLGAETVAGTGIGLMGAQGAKNLLMSQGPRALATPIARTALAQLLGGAGLTMAAGAPIAAVGAMASEMAPGYLNPDLWEAGRHPSLRGGSPSDEELQRQWHVYNSADPATRSMMTPPQTPQSSIDARARAERLGTAQQDAREANIAADGHNLSARHGVPYEGPAPDDYEGVVMPPNGAQGFIDMGYRWDEKLGNWTR